LPTLRFISILLVCLGLLLIANSAGADELTIEVKGIKGAPLTNVQARVEPFRLTGNARLSRRKLEEIRESTERRARSALQPYGYYHPTITSEISRAGERAWLLQLNIKLGSPVKVASLALELTGPGAGLEDLANWKSDWPLKPGKRLNQANWESQKQKALDIAEDNGYLGAVFSEHRMEVDLEKNEASLYLVLDTGIQAVMGDIQFEQDSVKPHVMENLPRFRPGDPYNSWMMEKFRLDVWKTGYFENIEVIENRHMDQSPPIVDLQVRLEPRKKNTYQGTLGYGSDTGPRLLFSWNRHLISGNGDSFSLGTGYQQHNNEFFVRGNYRVPRDVRSRQFWIADVLGKNQNQDLEVDVDYGEQAGFKLADSRVSDYSFRLGRLKVRDQESGYRQLFETMYLQYLKESVSYKPDFRNQEDLIRRLRQEPTDSDWTRTTQSLTLGIDYDMPLIRGEGFENVGYHHRAWAFTSNTAWGSDASFTQAYLSSRWNFIVGRRWKFLLRGEAGYSDANVEDYSLRVDDTLLSLSITDLPNLYRFKAGGSNSVRGYSYESLTNNGIGSNNIVTASAEVEFQVLPKWSGAVFFDIGNAFNDWNEMDLKRGVGFGVRWYTIAGAVRVDLAQALDLPGDPWRLNFSIGISLL
jgi:translocation and assembly module TamA